MQRGLVFSGFFFIIIVIAGVSSVSAIPTDEYYRGTIVKTDPANATISINTTAGEITGAVPDSAVFTMLGPGDRIIAAGDGNSPVRWSSLAAISYDPNREEVWYILGDPAKITPVLHGNYSVGFSMAPDCTQCEGPVCRAANANVSLIKSGKTVSEAVLYPGNNASDERPHRIGYQDPADLSTVRISFISGETDAGKCKGTTASGVDRPVQVFEIYDERYYPGNEWTSSLVLVISCIAIVGLGMLVFYLSTRRT